MTAPWQQTRTQQRFERAYRYLKCNNLRRLDYVVSRWPELLTYCGISTLLFLAAWRPNYGAVKLLLSRGADPDFTGDSDNTVLMHAAAENDVRLATQLIDHGAALEKHNDRFETPLGYACAYVAVDVVRLLCERGADVNGTEGWAKSYLWGVQCASETNPLQAEIEQILRAHGARSFEEPPKLKLEHVEALACSGG